MKNESEVIKEERCKEKSKMLYNENDRRIFGLPMR